MHKIRFFFAKAIRMHKQNAIGILRIIRRKRHFGKRCVIHVQVFDARRVRLIRHFIGALFLENLRQERIADRTRHFLVHKRLGWRNEFHLEEPILHHRRIHEVFIFRNHFACSRTDNAIERHFEISVHRIKQRACHAIFIGREPIASIKAAQRNRKIRRFRRIIVLRIPFRKIFTVREAAPLATNIKRVQFFATNFLAAHNERTPNARNSAKRLHRQQCRGRAIFIRDRNIAAFRDINRNAYAL